MLKRRGETNLLKWRRRLILSEGSDFSILIKYNKTLSFPASWRKIILKKSQRKRSFVVLLFFGK